MSEPPAKRRRTRRAGGGPEIQPLSLEALRAIERSRRGGDILVPRRIGEELLAAVPDLRRRFVDQATGERIGGEDLEDEGMGDAPPVEGPPEGVSDNGGNGQSASPDDAPNGDPRPNQPSGTDSGSGAGQGSDPEPELETPRPKAPAPRPAENEPQGKAIVRLLEVFPPGSPPRPVQGKPMTPPLRAQVPQGTRKTGWKPDLSPDRTPSIPDDNSYETLVEIHGYSAGFNDGGEEDTVILDDDDEDDVALRLEDNDSARLRVDLVIQRDRRWSTRLKYHADIYLIKYKHLLIIFI